ncbi:hypothetical protein D3C72_1742030 [compost metagenome]
MTTSTSMAASCAAAPMLCRSNHDLYKAVVKVSKLKTAIAPKSASTSISTSASPAPIQGRAKGKATLKKAAVGL